MKIYRLACYFLLLIFAFSCTKDQMPLEIEFDNQLRSQLNASAETGDFRYYILPDENDLSKIPQDPKNPLTIEKVNLGKFLFYETGFAMEAVYPEGIGTYSCSSCHVAEAGFRPGRSQGIGDGGVGFGVNGDTRVRNSKYKEHEMDVQSARPLSMLNVAYVTNTFWNGQFGSTEVNIGTGDVWDQNDATFRNFLGYEGIETQNFEGLELHRILITKELIERYGYKEMFDEAFPELPDEEKYSNFAGSLALSAYIRTILSNKAPFQRWLKGEQQAMSVQEKKGGILFFSKAGCVRCHYRPNLGSLEFHALGANDLYQIPSFNTSSDDPRNLGRAGFTKKDEDLYKFKVPQLYNLTDAPFFFHGSSKRTLDELIDYKLVAQSENHNVPNEMLSSKFLPVDLNEEEKAQLKAFLASALRDPNLTRYVPPYVLSGFCFPNNDPQASIDLGCD